MRIGDFDTALTNLPLTFSLTPPARIRIDRPLAQQCADGRLVVPRGFVCDGASIPRVARWYQDPFDPRVLRAAICHDLRCSRFPLNGQDWHIGTWRMAHEMFAEGCRAGGLTGWRFQAVTKAVRWFGPRWPDTQVVPVDEAAGLLAHFPFDWHPADR